MNDKEMQNANKVLLWYIVLLYKMFHTKIPELTAMKIIILPPLLQKKGLKKPHHITTF